ncbi:MAG TPA: polysaccharide deacetylase family protein [Anaerohalosphaeraceae bacterium]|jgi:predicted glycoside hydrolase/deacetylase ChbG (UPF0249 family)|nr:polysaccharide deacetylase family protein [Anaerohalosphaeraceae bacterium]HRT49599.1 polysaccharide deacetylase family protein [Anaerohalosphaeraceae bacterium]HRT85466.1 polysaccharide deacetylase family protein [Anaerohalosphaeraceae bacterium]
MERRMLLQAAVALIAALGTICGVAQAQGNAIRLIVRADDIGSSHAANVACIKSYREGVARSVEVMVPCPWFNEAVEMLNANPGYDVGVHLTLTSEWTNLKWRPLTHCPSLVEEQGNFYPMVWPNANIGPDCSIREADPKIEEVEQELRAQIELAVRKIKNVTHLSSHMGFGSARPDIAAVVDKLAAEYKLPIRVEGAKGARMERARTPEEKVAAFVKMLENLEPGLWIFVEHPGLDVPEMRAIGHKGYEDVAIDRQGVTDMFTSPEAMEVIKRRGIELVSYGEVLKASRQR